MPMALSMGGCRDRDPQQLQGRGEGSCSYQVNDLLELGEGLQGALPGLSHLAQGVLVGSLAQRARQGTQTHVVTPLLCGSLSRPLQGSCGKLSWKGEGVSWQQWCK